MYIPIEHLPRNSRVWIYQSDKKLSAVEKDIISGELRTFTEQWLVHGAALEASFALLHDQFVVLAANDSASGCSIDSSVRVMKELGQKLGVDFLNRTQIAFSIAGSVVLFPVTALERQFKDGVLKPDTPVFNNAVSTLGEFRDNWPTASKKTWVSRYFRNETITNNG